MRNRLAAFLALTLALVGAAVLPATAAHAAPNCTLFVSAPYFDGEKLIATGGANCPAPQTISIRLRQDISWWPDRTLGIEPSSYGTSANLTIWYPCNPFNSGMRVFTETMINGGQQKRQSAHVGVPCS